MVSGVASFGCFAISVGSVDIIGCSVAATSVGSGRAESSGFGLSSVCTAGVASCEDVVSG